MRELAAIALLLGVLSQPVRADQPHGWITHPQVPASPVVLEFQRTIQLSKRPESFIVQVTADNRFVLSVNGRRAAGGPSTGTVLSWRVSSIDLAPYLRRGENRIAATVWNFGEHAPAAQQSVSTGFKLGGADIDTSQPGWRVKIIAGHRAGSGAAQFKPQYYVAGAPEIIDARVPDSDWQDAVPAPAAAARRLITDPLPPQKFAAVDPGRVARSTLAGGNRFPAKPVTVPANSTAKLLMHREAMVSGYPELEVSGGRDATIRMTWTEALVDSQGNKGNRAEVGDRLARGLTDTFIADGTRHSFAPLWWRTFRFVEIEVSTQDQPLTLRALRLHETGYPFEQVAHFHSSDAELNRIWDIGWRTQRVDAHETFMDSSYWEQLQYAGDTRLQMLIGYAVAGDARLARQAIEAFAQSDVDGGLMQGAYPSRLDNVIATFAFAWVGMLADWSLQQPDEEFLARQLPRMRRALAWFEPYLNSSGLLGKSPHWNFIDWAGQRWDDRDTFPSWGRNNGSCLMTAMWVGALRQGAALEALQGEAAHAGEQAARADRARDAIRAHCWNAQRGLFADDTDLAAFSQHMNVFAVLYDIATREEAPGILERIVVRGQGIDAPPDMYASTFYFAWYLVRAFEHAGMSDRYFELLRSWRDLLPLGYTTWPETRLQPRSDTHAWSAHPTADLLGIVAGIRPAAPGYARLRVAPHLGALTSLDATAATPHGPVSVSYRVRDGKLTAIIRRPASQPGEFTWRGTRHELTGTRTRLVLDSEAHDNAATAASSARSAAARGSASSVDTKHSDRRPAQVANTARRSAP